MNFLLHTKSSLCALCLLTSPFAAIAQIPTNGLVAYYPFNGNANDESGNGNHGTVIGAKLTTDRFGIPNKAYSFNGINDYIRVNNGTAFNFDNTNAFTLNVWINPNSSQLNYAGILDKSHAHILNGNTLKGFILQKALSSFSFYSAYGCGMFDCGANWHGDDPGHNIPVAANLWTMLTVTLQNGMLKYYSNGLLVAHFGQNQSPFVGNGNLPLFIGAVNGLDRYFNGKIDDIRIYNRALSTSEIVQLYTLSITDVDRDPSFLKVKLHPNPTFDRLIIDFPTEIQMMSIVNSLGQLVKKLEINELGHLDVDVSGLPKGIYYLCIQDQLSKKFIKL